MTDIFTGDPKIFETDASFIAYRVAGTGPALLLLHGYPQTMYMWHQIVGWPRTILWYWQICAAMVTAENPGQMTSIAPIQSAKWQRIWPH